MASYSRPDVSSIQEWTGINLPALADSTNEILDLDQFLDSLCDQSEAQVAQYCGESLFDSSALTARQAQSLQEAVANGAGWRFLRHAQTDRTLGTHEPLLMEGSGDIEEVIRSLQATELRLAKLVASGPGIANAQVLSSFTTADQTPADESGSSRQFGRNKVLW